MFLGDQIFNPGGIGLSDAGEVKAIRLPSKRLYSVGPPKP